MIWTRRSLLQAITAPLSVRIGSLNAEEAPRARVDKAACATGSECREDWGQRPLGSKRYGIPDSVDTIEELRSIAVTPGRQIAIRRYAGKESVEAVYVGATRRGPDKFEDDGCLTLAPDGGTGSNAWVRIGSGLLNVKSFGAEGDGVNDDTEAIAMAIGFAQQTGCNLHFGHGTFKITSTIELSGSAVALVGEGFAVRQQGSLRPTTSIQWFGGAAPMFRATSPAWRFIGLSAENHGSATDFMTAERVQYLHVEDCSFVLGTGAKRFSNSIFRSFGNSFGYSKWIRTMFQGAAPSFIYIDGIDTSNGVTSIEINGGIFESNSGGDVDILKIVNEKITSVVMKNATYNQQVNQLCIVDTTENQIYPSICQFTFAENEIDTADSKNSDRYFRLNNVANVAMDNNYFQAGGQRAAMAELANSIVTSFKGNYLHRCPGPFFDIDSKSDVYAGANNFELRNTKGIVGRADGAKALTSLPYASTIVISGRSAPPGTLKSYRIDVTDGANWTLALAQPLSSNFIQGQVIEIQIRNMSNEKIGKVLFSPKHFRLSDNLFSLPKQGHNRTTFFVWDGECLVEICRSHSDIMN